EVGDQVPRLLGCFTAAALPESDDAANVDARVGTEFGVGEVSHLTALDGPVAHGATATALDEVDVFANPNDEFDAGAFEALQQAGAAVAAVGDDDESHPRGQQALDGDAKAALKLVATLPVQAFHAGRPGDR